MGEDRPVVWCRRCGRKRAQYPNWLCRVCDVAAGTFAPRAHVPRRTCRRCGEVAATAESLCGRCWQQVALGAGATVMVEVAPGPGREYVIGGRVYVVVWDGSRT